MVFCIAYILCFYFCSINIAVIWLDVDKCIAVMQPSIATLPCAGLGWMAVGVKGPADLRVWVHKGVGVTTHASLLPDYAQAFERPGFSNSNIKAVDKAKSRAGSKVATREP